MRNVVGDPPVAGGRLLPSCCLLHRASCVLLLASCLLLLAACSFPGTVRPTVKIGLVAPFEGRYRYVGYDVIYAVRLAVREVNQAGGIRGHSVELVAYDDMADPALAVEQARKLAIDPEVVAAIGHFRAESTDAAAHVYADAGISLLSPGSIAPHADALAAEMLAHLKTMGVDRVALVTQGGSIGAVLQHDAQVGQVTWPDDGDWLAEAMAFDGVICDADPVTAGEVAQALRDEGWTGLFIGGPEMAAADFSAVAGEAAEGALFVTPWPFPPDVPKSAGFVGAYQGMGPHVEPPGPLAIPAYEAAWQLFEALEDDIAVHAVPTRAGVAAALVQGTGAATLHWYRVSGDGELTTAP
jgi:branched-chain amino acid transport system substrate-binding protein